MAAFLYKAMDRSGRTVSGRIEAANDADLENRLGRMGLDLINFQPTRAARGTPWRRRVGRPELIQFCFHLEQLLRAGVPILESLADLRDSSDNPRMRELIASLIEDIQGGRTLSQALAGFPEVFDPVFVNLVRAGEHSGMLPEILRRLSESLKWQDELAAHTRRILMYPAFVGVVVLGVVMFLMIYLVPQLVAFIENMGHGIPLHTRLLIAVSEFVAAWWYLILLTPPALLFGLRLWARHDMRMRYRVDGWKLRLPPVGPIYRKIILARFAGNFALLYRAGVPILDALRIGQDLVGNEVISEALARVRLQIGEGEQMTRAFENTGLFPPLVVRMIRVGEQSGELDGALDNVSYFYNRDVRESIGRVQAMIEPTLTVILGVLLGWVMLSVLGPVYDMLGDITR